VIITKLIVKTKVHISSSDEYSRLSYDDDHQHHQRTLRDLST
jgi:hypothetical protein